MNVIYLLKKLLIFLLLQNICNTYSACVSECPLD